METGQLSVSLRVLSVSVLSFRLGRSHHGVHGEKGPLSITGSHSAQFHIPLHRAAAPVQHIYFESRKRRAKPGFFPALNGEVAVGGMTKRILRHSHSVPAYVGAAQMQNPHLESFDTTNFSFDIGDRGHGLIQV